MQVVAPTFDMEHGVKGCVTRQACLFAQASATHSDTIAGSACMHEILAHWVLQVGGPVEVMCCPMSHGKSTIFCGHGIGRATAADCATPKIRESLSMLRLIMLRRGPFDEPSTKPPRRDLKHGRMSVLLALACLRSPGVPSEITRTLSTKSAPWRPCPRSLSPGVQGRAFIHHRCADCCVYTPGTTMLPCRWHLRQ